MSSPISEESVRAAVAAALADFAAAEDSTALRAAKTLHTNDGSALARLNASLKELDPADRPAAGQLIGRARGEVAKALADREAVVLAAEEAAKLAEEAVDVTALPERGRTGARHPIPLLMERMADVFVGMGWEVAEGPELENEWFNFDALNFDPDHPARAMQDTFFVEPVARHLLLRTHTSPVQSRSMLGRDLPIYVVAPGRVYRTDELDATHTPVFHQIEGLAVDKGLTMAHLKGTLEHLARAMFGPEARIRLRSNFFPFTEPSAEMDVWHPHAKGGPRWIEWGGCGMTNPNILRAAGIDPEVYQGFAFGMGIERTLQFITGSSDMRDMVEGDVRYAERFGMVI